MANEHRTATIDELWVEFKEAIKYGDFKKFKTRRGFDGYIKRLINGKPGKGWMFIFDTGDGLLTLEVEITEEMINGKCTKGY